jgi:hypothetical protein
MSQSRSIDFARVCSILGYCLLPIVLLALLAIMVDFRFDTACIYIYIHIICICIIYIHIHIMC